MQNFLQNTFQNLKKNEQKLLIFQKKHPFSQKLANKPKVSKNNYHSQDKNTILSDRSSIPNNNFKEINEKLKEIQMKNQQAVNKNRNGSLKPFQNSKNLCRNIEKIVKNTKITTLNVCLPKENDFKLKILHPSALLVRRNLEKKRMEQKENRQKKELKTENLVFYEENPRNLPLNGSNKDYDSTNYTEKEENPRDFKDFKAKTIDFYEKKKENKEFLKSFHGKIRDYNVYYSPIRERMPQWKTGSIENQFEKLNDLMEKTKTARDSLLEIQLRLFDSDFKVIIILI